MLPLTLPRNKRITDRKVFLGVQRFGVRQYGQFLTIICQKQAVGKLGITVSKKVGPAHDRNLVKRRLRHIYRTNQHLFDGKYLVVIAKSESNGCQFLELANDFLSIYRKINHIMQSQKSEKSYRPQGARRSHEHTL
jgi:ribonuclease P protein component